MMAVAPLPHLERAVANSRSAVRQLLSSQVAEDWGATAVMLHVDASNDAASELYRQKQYRLLAEPRRSGLAEAVTSA